MAEVMNMPAESLDRRRDRQSEKKEKSDDETPSTLPSQQPPSAIPPASRRRDRDSRERRVDDTDRPGPGGGGGAPGGGNRNNRDYHHDNNNRNLPRDRERDRERDNNNRDRERDYKRRGSPSPPPPYRDRRGHSPPPFKRSRRDDGPNFDGRRGSPRGGGGGGRGGGFGPPDDRRFGYDYAGGYERGGPGGRGYGDERPYGRHMNRPPGGYHNGPSDWDSGRGGFNDALNSGSMQREGLMSYKQFIQELEDDILPAEAERRYQEYRSEYITTQKRTFFDAHKDDEWLKDKYHPTNLVSVIERRNDAARKVAKDFMLDLQSGTLDIGPGVSPTLASKSGNGSDPNSEDEAETGSKRRRHGRGPARENDLLSAAPKAHPVSSEPRRIEADIGQAQSLVRKLDKEKGIEENILCSVDNDKDGAKSHAGSMGPIIIIRGLTSVKGLEGMELLDTLLTYLWRVHGLDYYGVIETNEAKGLRHVRVEGKSYDETAAAEWEKKVDSSWQARLLGEDPLEVMTGKEKIEEATVEGLDPFVRKIRDEKYGWKYGCGAKGCTKLFHAAEFVHKHLRLKHLDLVMDLTSKVREELYFYNYMNDTDAPGGQPVMQQPLPREMPQRRRQNLDNQRLRDDRGNHHRRDHERIDRNGGGDERFDKTEHSPSRDVQSNTTGGGGAMDGRGGDPDEPMYDTYGGAGGPGLHGAQFPSDLAPPPPVLMPVPGAGPLGPFVPAPPEVAMRMLREQGGAPFEGTGARNGRVGPQVIGGGPTPIIAVSPAFRPDPRRLRSYQDLDAPEDEVTVIDYRSL
ncbi:hypothetical protein MKW98_032424 [Papaver atlanticum]|uniref:C2H2-type domain-containing protein n=1 Tax=Papaver atlanticum TaxID=357466 RepID=A0AAD4XLG0_9MAGN|nr:hypothetical protein MKW98_032424 [Papaver atlanticum]